MRGNTYYFRTLQNWEYIGCVQGVTNLQCAKHIQDTLNKVHLLRKSRKIRTSLGKRKFRNISSTPLSKKTQTLLCICIFSTLFFHTIPQFCGTGGILHRQEANQTQTAEHCFPTYNTQFQWEQQGSWSLHHLPWSSTKGSLVSKAVGRASSYCSHSARATCFPSSILSHL